LDEIIDIERSPAPRILLEERPNIPDHRVRSLSVGRARARYNRSR
jgi:hypothetical protein